MKIKVTSEPSPFKNTNASTFLVGLPWDWESARQGTRYFPHCFRQAGLVLGPSVFHDRKIIINDIGNLSLHAKNTAESHKVIRDCAAELFISKNKTVFLGGDHSVTIPILEGINSKACVIVFDAHADALEDDNAPLSERVLQMLIKNKNVEKIVVIGCRSGAKDFKNKKVFFEDLEITYTGKISNELRQIIGKYDKLYISFDFDVIEPAFISEVSYPQPLGIEPRIAIALLDSLIDKRVIGMDFVEFNPNLNENVSRSMHNAIEIILSALEKLNK